MFKIKKTFEIEVAHHLNLPYESKCKGMHGHTEIITIWCCANDEETQKNNGMVIDFSEIKRLIHDALDHKCLNEVEWLGYEDIPIESIPDQGRIELNPTAENTAKWICNRIPNCYKVSVQETTGNVATYIDDTFKMKR